MSKLPGHTRWRTWLRMHTPSLLYHRSGLVVPKARDCGDHSWYRQDDATDACYHCRVTRPIPPNLREPAGPHDPDRTVMAALLEACPSFVDAWDRHLAEWADSSDRGAYIDVGVFAKHLVGLLERHETDEFAAVFETIERLFGEGDYGVRYLLTAGLIEDLGNIGSNAHGWPFALQFREWFGPNANRAWDDVRAIRGGE